MTPVALLWQEGALGALRADVESRMADGFGSLLFRSAGCDLCPSRLRELGARLAALYTELIRLDATDTVLHIALVLPLWEDSAAERACALIDAAAESTHAFTVDILGLQGGLRPDAGTDAGADRRAAESAVLRAVAERCARAPFPCRLCVTDNYSSTGASADFSDRLLARFICALLGVMIENFADSFARVMPDAARLSVVAPGVSCLELRRERMADYLLSRAFVSALDEAGVMQETVDAQGASERAQACLKGIDNFYREFYDTEVEPLIAQRLPESEIAARVRKPLDAAVDALAARITAFMGDASLSLPEKEAVWASMLGLDNERLKGTLYKQDYLVFDDGFSQPAALYIDAFNSYDAGSGLLPMRGQYPPLASRDEDDSRNHEAFAPLANIKAIKAEMLDITAYMRAKEQEIDAIQDADVKGNMARGHLSEEGFVFGGVVRRLESGIVEEPLQEVYAPAPGLKPLPSVDLRRFFSPVRDQGPVGSCTAFAVAGMYEAIMNRNNPSLTVNADLSERFIFYHTNINKGKGDEGSSFHDQLNVMGRFGICAEALFPYTPECMDAAPSAAATADALNHRVTLARQVPLRSEGSKYDCVTANHAMLTSALTEGYPVGISLMLFDDFGSHPGGHVPRPADDAVEHGEHGHHAMVIVGYSERDKCYIVRNSWGEDFGDKGYCYISASYIDDPALCRFACVIADTTDGPATGGAATSTPALVAPFAGTEAQIKVASATNALDESRIHLKSLADLYTELYRYYADLLQRLSQPFVRNELRMLSEQASMLRISELKARQARLVAEMPQTLRAACREYIMNCLKVSAFALGVAALAGLCSYVDAPGDMCSWAWLAAVLSVVVAIAMWVNYKWFRRRRRRELQEEIDATAAALGREERNLFDMQLRFHVAGMAIDSLQALSTSLQADYHRLVSFNNNLRGWHDEDSRKAAELDTDSEAMFVNLTDRGLLDAFFERHRRDVSGRIDLLGAFAGFTLNADGMQRVRVELEQATRSAIEPLFADFSMAAYIMGTRVYPYLPRPELDTMLKRLNRMANVLTRHRCTDSSYVSKYLIAKVDAAERTRWLGLCTPHFAYQPMTLDSADADRLSILQLNLIPVDDLVL